MKNILLFLTCLCFISCQPQQSLVPYPTRDYLTVRLHLDTLNAHLQEEFDRTSTYTLPYTDLRNGKKRLVFFGASHARDQRHPPTPN
jgi:hypothetical protein